MLAMEAAESLLFTKKGSFQQIYLANSACVVGISPLRPPARLEGIDKEYTIGGAYGWPLLGGAASLMLGGLASEFKLAGGLGAAGCAAGG